MSIGAGIAAAVVLLAVNAFFVGAEFALISARRSALEPRAATSRAARTTIRAMENVSVMMAGAQLGITICSLGLGALGEPAVATALEPLFAVVGLPEAALHPVAFAVALLIVVALHVSVGEMVPKNIALAVPERAALVLAPPLVAVVTVLRPFLWVLGGLANFTLRALRVEPRDEMASAFGRDEVAGMIEQSRAHGLLERDEAELVTGALAFAERTVDEIAVPSADIVSCPAATSVADLEVVAHTRGFSRLPLTGGTGHLGYVHVKDLAGASSAQRDRPVPADWIRPLRRLDPATTLPDALGAMRREGAHLALVSGPAHGPAALVALDDVLAALVGDIRHAGTPAS